MDVTPLLLKLGRVTSVVYLGRVVEEWIEGWIVWASIGKTVRLRMPCRPMVLTSYNWNRIAPRKE